jgi:predicted transcriptional regulator
MPVPKQLLDKISIYVPKSKLENRPVERLIKLAETKDRSVNYLVVEAILEYLEREDKKSKN